MATLQIEFRNGKFLSNNGVNVEIANETYIEGNGWVGNVYDNGEIAFLSTQFYSGVRHQLKFRIKNGYIKKLLKIGKGRPRVLKSYKLKEWPVDGVIGLSNGHVDKRVCYFRTDSFQKFLDEHQITAIRFEPANGIFRLESKKRRDKLDFLEEVQTDGNCKMLYNPDENKETNSENVIHMVEVTDASWVIKTVWKSGKIRHRILYTLDDPKQIIGLPNNE